MEARRAKVEGHYCQATHQDVAYARVKARVIHQPEIDETCVHCFCQTGLE